MSGFSLIMNVMVLSLFLLPGVLFLVENLPPGSGSSLTLTYGVDGPRASLTRVSASPLALGAYSSRSATRSDRGGAYDRLNIKMLFIAYHAQYSN